MSTRVISLLQTIVLNYRACLLYLSVSFRSEEKEKQQFMEEATRLRAFCSEVSQRSLEVEQKNILIEGRCTKLEEMLAEKEKVSSELICKLEKQLEERETLMASLQFEKELADSLLRAKSLELKKMSISFEQIKAATT